MLWTLRVRNISIFSFSVCDYLSYQIVLVLFMITVVEARRHKSFQSSLCTMMKAVTPNITEKYFNSWCKKNVVFLHFSWSLDNLTLSNFHLKSNRLDICKKLLSDVLVSKCKSNVRGTTIRTFVK